jgi:DHA1 family bicyclomycin/chloramphenicol resistance-like MFS transporter
MTFDKGQMTKSEHRILVIMLGMLAATGPLSIDMYLPSLPSIQSDLAASAADTQLSLSAFLIGYACGQLLYGPISDRFGRKPVLLTGMFAYAATSFLCTLSTNIETLIVLRFLQALGGGSGIVLARAIINDYFPANEAAQVLSLVSIVTMLGPLVSPIIGGYLLVLAGWHSIFWLLSAMGTIFFLMVYFVFRESHLVENRQQLNFVSTFKAYVKITLHKDAFGYIACGGLGAGVFFAYIGNSPFVFIELFGVRPEYFGYLYGIVVSGMMAAAIINSRLVLRYGLDRMIEHSNFIRLIGIVLLLLVSYFKVGGIAAMVFALVVTVAPTIIINVNAAVGLLHLFPRLSGTASAVSGAAIFATGAVSGSIVGLLHDGTVMPMVITMTLFALTSHAAYWLVGRKEG